MANLAPKLKLTFSLKTLFAVFTVVAVLVAYFVNERQWRKQHGAVVRALKDATVIVESSRQIWTPKFNLVYLVVTSPDGRSSYMSLHESSPKRWPDEEGPMLEADHFGCAYCRYLRTVDDRDLYEICIGPGITSMSFKESGKTPGIVVKYVSFEGKPIVVMDERGYRVVMERYELAPTVDTGN